MSKDTPRPGRLPLTESAFAAMWERAFREFARRQEEIDQRMHAALCGGPFYSLEDCLPIDRELTMSNINTIEHHNEVICKAAREALIGTGLELLAHGYAPQRYVSPAQDTDDYEIRIGVTSAPFAQLIGCRIVARQLIPCCAAYAGDVQLIAEVNRACMDARQAVHAQLTALAAKVDPSR